MILELLYSANFSLLTFSEKFAKLLTATHRKVAIPLFREKDLINLRQVRYRDGEGVSLETLQFMLAKAANAYDIPIEFDTNQIKYGGLINSKTLDCLMLYHPEHPGDYNSFLFTITIQGKYAFVSIYLNKVSTLEFVEEIKGDIRNFSSLNSYGKGFAVAGLVGATLTGKLFHGKNKYEDEQNWYTMVKDIFDDVFES